KWSNLDEYLRHAVDADATNGCLVLKYRAVEVNVVMKPEDIYWKQVFVKQDGAWLSKDIAGQDIQYDENGQSFVRVDLPRMYNLIDSQPYGTYELQLSTKGKGLSVYSFSFGTCADPKQTGQIRSPKGSS